MPEEHKKKQWEVHHIDGKAGTYSEEMTEKILEHLKKLDLLTADQADSVLKLVKRDQINVADVIINSNFLKEREAGQAIAAYFNCVYVPFAGTVIPHETISIIPKEICKKAGVIIFEETDDLIRVAMIDPSDIHFLHLLEQKTGKKAEARYATPKQLNIALKSYPSESEGTFDTLLSKASQNISHLESLDSISQVFDTFVLMAYKRGASDVHIEPFEDEIRVRFRIDGVLNIVTSMPIRFQETIINHIKVLSKLRTDTHNAAQDGRFHVSYEKTTINFRVSILPTHYGEKAVLRLLTTETQEWTLNELGYTDADHDVIDKYISKTNGMILCCGPTGSGKTTTLYAVLKEVNNEGVNISTIEDPIEYGLPGIMQIQVNPNTNLSYAEGLKSLMRQDPDVLMIGEIRDFETGKIAVNAALTGHLVLSTLHTNNASLAPLRLLQMGADPYLIVTTVNLIIAQRLVRKICKKCLTSYTLSNKDLEALEKRYGIDEGQKALFMKYFNKGTNARLFKGRGCEKCGGTGFHGRIVAAEVLVMKDNIRDLILAKKNESDIEKAAVKNGMTTMFEDGLKKVKEGVTTLEELLRVINQ